MQDRISEVGGVSRRQVAAIFAGTALMLPGPAFAQAPWPLPGKPVRILVGLVAGGPLDAQARSLAHRLSELCGVPVTVDNRPGASAMLAVHELMRSAPDGHTLMFAPSAVFAQNPHTLAHIAYDPFKDFTPITLAARGPLVLVLHTSVPANNAAELVAWARHHPGHLNFANFGTGTASHIYAAAFARAAAIDVVHVPYKGSADAARDLLEGRVQAFFDASPGAMQYARTGRVRMLGVAAASRSPALPGVATLAEQGLHGLDLPGWTALVGPAGMPGALTAQVNDLVTRALQSVQVRTFIAGGGYEVVAGTPAHLADEVIVAHARWGELVRQLGIPKQ